MTLKDAVKQTPYKAGAIAAAIFHFIVRSISFKKESWVGSGGYYGLVGLLIPFLVEKKNDNPTVKAFACGWRNTFIFLAIGESLYYIAKSRGDKDERATIPLLVICGAAAGLSIKAESAANLVPVSAPAQGTGSGNGTNNLAKNPPKRVKVVVSGKKMYTVAQ